MTALIIDGTQMAQKLRAVWKLRANRLNAQGIAPGLAVVCEQSPQLSGGSLYTDPHPQPRPFVAGKAQPPGAKDTASITVALSSSCPAPALQVSPGGATINGLPRPVLIPMR